MKAKLVKENLNEAYRKDGHNFDVHKIGLHEYIWVGNDGVMGNDNYFLSWELLKQMAKKYNIPKNKF